MFANHPLRSALLILLALSLMACDPVRVRGERQATFFVSIERHGPDTGYVPSGTQWNPNSPIELSVFGEPDGPGSARQEWTTIRTTTTLADGSFGNPPRSTFHIVRGNICGRPRPGQTMIFSAKNLNTGRILTREMDVRIYFTHEPCPDGS